MELQFYLIVPIILPFLRKRFWLLLLVILGSLFAALVITEISPKTSFFMMPLRIWEFLLGVAAAWYPAKLQSQSKERAYLFLALALLFLVIFFLHDNC